jgi:hypothetical protein
MLELTEIKIIIAPVNDFARTGALNQNAIFAGITPQKHV